MKRTLQRIFPAALALFFAGTLQAAETSFENGTLTITFTASSEEVDVANDGTTITVTSNEPITGEASFISNEVNRIVVTGSDNVEGQSLTFLEGTEITLSAGLLVSGVEQVVFINALTSTGSSGIGVVAKQNIQILKDFTGGDGGISLTGQGIEVSGETGVLVLNAKITTTGSISITGTGGSGGQGKNGNGYQRGIVLFGAEVETTGTASITMNGTGGNGNYDGNEGIMIEGSTVTAEDGNIVIHGTGGNSEGGSRASGVIIIGSNEGSNEITIKTTGSGNISITGIGGHSESDAWAPGVTNWASTIKTADSGDISITGKGGIGDRVEGIMSTGEIVSANGHIVLEGEGGTGSHTTSGILVIGEIVSANGNIVMEGKGGSVEGVRGEVPPKNGPDYLYGGINLYEARVEAAGTASISMTGTGGEGASNYLAGVGITSSEITAKNGNIVITGAGGEPNDGFSNDSGVRNAESTITTTGTGLIKIIGDQILIHESNATITAASSTVILRPLTIDWPINLGGADSKDYLALTNGELNRITAGKLIIGHIDAGTISIIDNIALNSSTNTELHGGGDIIFEEGGFNTGGGSILLSPGASPKAVKPNFDGTDVSANTLSFAGNLAIVINGTTPGDGTGNTHTQLTVDGYIILTGVELDVSGSHDPAPGESFTIVKALNNFNITGTFDGLPEGGLIDDFLGSGRGAFITYTGGAGNDVVITTCTPLTSGGTIAAAQTICHGTSPEAFTSVTPPAVHLGYLEYQWQLNTSTPTATWMDVGTVTTAADYYHAHALTQTTWFRRLARVSCDPVSWETAVSSNVVKVNVLTTNATDHFRSTANGNWDNISIWESSADNTTWCAATLVPAGDAASVVINHHISLAGNATVGDITISADQTLDLKNHQLQVTGNWTNNGTLEAGTSTVHFTGSGNNTLGGISTNTFYNLLISKQSDGSVTASGTLEVTNQLTVVEGSFTSASDYHDVLIEASGLLVLANDISVSGNWTNNGTFTPETNTVTFNGTAMQTLDGSTETGFYSLTTDNLAGVQLGNNQAVSHLLTLAGGIIHTGPFALIVESTNADAIHGASATSYINGTLVRSVDAGTANAYSFPVGNNPYTPVEVVFTAGTGIGTITAIATPENHPELGSSDFDPGATVNRYWTLNASGLDDPFEYDATFYWITPDDEDVDFDWGLAEAGKWTGSGWEYIMVSDRGTSSVTITGQTGFSDFQVANHLPYYEAIPLARWSSFLVFSMMVAFVLLRFDKQYRRGTSVKLPRLK